MNRVALFHPISLTWMNFRTRSIVSKNGFAANSIDGVPRKLAAKDRASKKVGSLNFLLHDLLELFSFFIQDGAKIHSSRVSFWSIPCTAIAGPSRCAVSLYRFVNSTFKSVNTFRSEEKRRILVSNIFEFRFWFANFYRLLFCGD